MVIKSLKNVNIVTNEQTHLKYPFWVSLDRYAAVQNNKDSNCKYYTDTSRFHFDFIFIWSLYELAKSCISIVPVVPYQKYFLGRQNFCWKKISSPRKGLVTSVRPKALFQETWLTFRSVSMFENIFLWKVVKNISLNEISRGHFWQRNISDHVN